MAKIDKLSKMMKVEENEVIISELVRFVERYYNGDFGMAFEDYFTYVEKGERVGITQEWMNSKKKGVK